ncbi:MAG: PAS domain S-box protein [Verrucomicrobia bacterium]|nr:MAG: PAS domain S-box protein [Verrucomicrobiota bacterium]
MSWVTVIWSIGSGACLTLALMHVVIWCKDRAARANLLFAIMATAVAVFAALELAMMRAETPGQFGVAVRWLHVPAWVVVASLVGFVRLYLRAGRRWLAWTVVGVRTVSLILNFIFSPNINYRQITALRHVSFLGEPVSVAAGVPNPWMLVAQLSLLLLIIFVTDATITVWRRGDRRQALIVGGSILLFVTAATAEGIVIAWGIISIPLSVSLFYQAIVAAMACELSYDVLHAAKLTQQFQASEAALLESEARINLAANAANLGLWLWNIPGDELWVTEEWRKLFGFTDSEPVTSDRWLQVVHPGDRERTKQLVQHMFEHGGEYENEYRITWLDGSTRWILGHGSVELDEPGKPAVARGVSRDITKRKIAEEELRESEGRFRTVADAAPVMIWMSGPDKLCIFFNKGWLDFTGRTMEQELGNGWAEGVHADDLERCLEVYETSFNARQPFTMEYRLRRNDGEYRWVLDSGTPRFAEDCAFVGYIGSCIDITARKQAELENQLQNMELARVGRVTLMGELAASLAHEVNNPIGAIVTNANAGQRLIAAGKINTEELKELLADIVADGHRAREVIQGVRNMVRKTEPSRSVIRINDTIDNLLRIVRADALGRQVTIAAEVDSDAGRVMADRVQLLQVLINLALNAFEAMSANRPDARRLVITGGRNGNGEIVVSLRDSGPGFPGAIGEQLFEPFFSTKAEGTGMGLAIARSIVEAHGGKLWGENCDDGGACFTFRLPEAKEDKSGAP